MIDNLYEVSRRFLEIYRKDFKRYFLKENPLESRFSIIIGPKGVGKTTVMIQYLNDFVKNNIFSKKALYIPADHFMVRAHSLYEIADDFVKEGGVLICFDEIHKYAKWSEELKSIYDSFPELKIIASGSSAIEIYKGGHDLSRRAVTYVMRIMSLREFIGLSRKILISSFSLDDILNTHQLIASDIIQTLKGHDLKILPLFKEYLRFGAYPYFVEFENKDLFYITLEQSIHSVIENDLPAVFPGLTGSVTGKINKLVAFIAGAVPFIPDLKKMKRLLEIGDERTLKTYLLYLERAGIISTLSKKGKSLSALEKPQKIFLHNPNLMYAISLHENLEKGSIREAFFMSAIKSGHKVTVAEKGDFVINEKYTFEVGGKGKSFKQIKNIPDSYLAIDEVEIGMGNKIPLWLLGFMY